MKLKIIILIALAMIVVFTALSLVIVSTAGILIAMVFSPILFIILLYMLGVEVISFSKSEEDITNIEIAYISGVVILLIIIGGLILKVGLESFIPFAHDWL